MVATTPELRSTGRTGVSVSALGLGCGGFGGIGSEPRLFGAGEDEETAFAIMDRALELGITHFDTANSYGGGRSEEIVGNWLVSRKTRDGIFLATKVYNPSGPNADDRGLSRAQVVKQIDRSLTRLQTDRVDLYLAHDFDSEVPIDETMAAFDEVVRAGKVRFVGASNFDADQLASCLQASTRTGGAAVANAQNAYNLLERGVEGELFPLCVAEGIGFTAHSPLAGGILTGKYALGERPPDNSRLEQRGEPYARLLQPTYFDAVDRLRKAAAETGVEPSVLGLAWVLSHPVVTTVLLGPRRLDHFRAAEAAIQLGWAQSDREHLTELVWPDAVR